MAELDLHLLPGELTTNIRFSKTGKFTVKESNKVDENLVDLVLVPFLGKSYEARQKYTFDLLVHAQILLYLRSALNHEGHQKLLEPKLKTPVLLGKVSFGQSYEVVYKEFYKRSIFDKVSKGNVQNIFDKGSHKPGINPALPWKDSVSPLYDREKAVNAINARIQALSKTLSISLPILNESKWFGTLVADLRKKGWLDWQILHVVAHRIVNRKMANMDRNISIEMFQKRFFEFIYKDEKEWYIPIDASYLGENEIMRDLEMMLPISVLGSFGLDGKASGHDAKV